jgi:hypothetical protein
VITPAVQVTAQDAFGNTATSFTGTVVVSITPLTGTPGAVLSGTTSLAATSGVVSYSNLSINLAGVGYKLDATSGGLTTTSATFNIL